MEMVEEEHEFRRQWKKRKDKMRGVIALAGLPATQKTYAALAIGRWAKCPVLCIQHFFSDDEKEEKEKKREEQVVQHGFATLCRVAKFHLLRRTDNPTVIVKSRLNSRFELERLIELVKCRNERYPLLSIECRMENKFEWRKYFEGLVDRGREEGDLDLEKRCMDWYRHTSWKDIEDVIEASRARQAEWDLHLQQLQLKASEQHDVIVRRLVLDISSESVYVGEDDDPPDEFFDAIMYLLTASKQELVNNFQSPYTIEFRQLRLYLLEKRWRVTESKGRSNNSCPMGDCVFKYEDSSIHDHCDYVCGVCEKLLTSGTQAYTCRLCILTMHKSCAERIDLWVLPNLKYMTLNFHILYGIPIIINHDCHQHFLSIKLFKGSYMCMACGCDGEKSAYQCKQCALLYHLRCALYPLQLLKHEHGGHVHEMKLAYSHPNDCIDPEESYWCDACYGDLDPLRWCYSCQICKYYVVHVHCADAPEYIINNVRDCIFVQQIQSQLEDPPS